MAQRTVVPALLVDLYELTMGQSYLDEGMAQAPATFSLFARHLPTNWGYFLAAGLDDVMDFLEDLRFSRDDLAYLETTGLFTAPFLDYLSHVRFSGSVRAIPEGTVFFPQEPLLEVTAPLLEAQLVESAVLNQIHFQTLVASKATWPGPKQVWRCSRPNGRFEDHIGLIDEHGPGDGAALLVEVMHAGRRIGTEQLARARERARSALANLPPEYRVLESPAAPPVTFAAHLQETRDALAADHARPTAASTA